MIRSSDEWEMSRSCQSATFSSAATALPRMTRARPLSFSPVIGLRLCGMALLPFWPAAKYSSTSSTSVRWRCRNSVALDDLRREHGGHQPKLLADVFLDARIEMRVGADRAGELAHGDLVARFDQPLLRASEFVVHQREIEAVGDRLGVDAVRAAHHG